MDYPATGAIVAKAQKRAWHGRACIRRVYCLDIPAICQQGAFSVKLSRTNRHFQLARQWLTLNGDISR